jgi:protein SCO1/2
MHGMIVHLRYAALAAFGALLAMSAARAHHPGADLDNVMGSKEKYFQAIDRPAPAFALMDAGGHTVRLSDLADKVVVLHFIYTGCPDVCPLHAEKLAEFQAMISRTPMKERIQFISVTTDPKNDDAATLRTYGEIHGLNPANWSFLTARPGQDEDVTRVLAEKFGHKFSRTADGYQTHGVVTHVLDRNGRWAANFHGLRFDTVNLVLYVNGLVNNADGPDSRPRAGWWQKLKGFFE